MHYDYQYKIEFKPGESFNLQYVINACRNYPNSKILVEVQNTKGISSSMLRSLSANNVAFRVVGGYDKDRIQRCARLRSSNYYFDSVIYSKNETIKIIEEIEIIEKGISNNWSEIQKLLYVYDRLKTSILYDPKCEQKTSSEIRSLRGLISKQTVCAGYALILKEILDRNGIDCEYVEGYTNKNHTGGHAWNIVNIKGKKYPIDLTWDNSKFRAGKAGTFNWLGTDPEKFSEHHIPEKGEKTQDYRHTLSKIDEKEIIEMYSIMGIGRSRDYSTTTYKGRRDDGSMFILAQLGNANINGKEYYRYYYVDVSREGRMELPIILYSDTNVVHFMDARRFNKSVPDRYGWAIQNVLFSKENIADSIAKKTFYIGKIRKDTPGNKVEVVSSTSEIKKPEEKRNLFTYPTRRFIRSDGSVFIAQKMLKAPVNVNGYKIMRYDIFEVVRENGHDVLKRNTVYSERDFFEDKRQRMIDDYLSRERLDRKVGETGGYIGYYSAQGIRTYNQDLVEYFKTSKKVELGDTKKSQNQAKPQAQTRTQTPAVTIPTFAELKSLAKQYEIFMDSNNPLEMDVSKIKVKDIRTGRIITDPVTIARAMFANIWLFSAGVKVYEGESRNGETYAFNGPAEALYNSLCNQMINSCKNSGVVDTVGIFRDTDNSNGYKYNREIVVGLFRTGFQAKVINNLFLKSLGMDPAPFEDPEPLYSMANAMNMAYGSPEVSSMGR
jgi:hypothetical protein